MSHITFDEVALSALDAMETHARSLSRTGVAVIAFAPGEEFSTWQSLARVVGRYSDPPNEKSPGANLLAIAYAKATEMAVTHRPSGKAGRPVHLGEVGWTGGDVKGTADGYWIAAFSGAPAEIDVLISQTGLKAAINES